MQSSRSRLVYILENDHISATLIDLPIDPNIDEVCKAYGRIKDLRILDIIDLAGELDLMREVYRHSGITPYQARHNSRFFPIINH